MSKTFKIISACAVCAAAIGLGTAAVMLNKDKNSLPTVNDIVEEPNIPEPVTEIPENLSDKYEYVPTLNGISDRSRSLMRLNKDVIGYIKMDGTQVDYPFVLDPGKVQPNDPFYGPEGYEPNYYYLAKDLYRRPDERGTLFADHRNVFSSNELEQSENLVIYGHSWYDGTMMGSLRKYRSGPEFYNQYPFIRISSNYKDYDYVIFAFLVTSGSYYDTDFRYWNMEDLDTEEEFNFYIDCCKRSWGLDTGIDVKYGDKLLTLSTCYADWDNSRFLVVARRLRDGEVAGDLNSIQHTEAYMQAQKEKEKSEETSQQ